MAEKGKCRFSLFITPNMREFVIKEKLHKKGKVLHKKNPGSPNGPPMVTVLVVRIFSGWYVTFIGCAEIRHA